jgi:hypothetical protein
MTDDELKARLEAIKAGRGGKQVCAIASLADPDSATCQLPPFGKIAAGSNCKSNT